MVFVVLFVLGVIVLSAFAISPTAGLVTLGLVVFVVFRLAKWGETQEQETNPVPPSTTPTRAAPKSKPAEADHRPPTPSVDHVEPWSGRARRVEVAGEFYRSDSIRRVFKGVSTRQEGGAELSLPAVLVPDPGNPFDSNAVAVYVSSEHVGYLAREDAKLYAGALAGLAAEGKNLKVASRQWARYDTYRQDLYSRVSLQIPEPTALLPVNRLPVESVILPAGSTVQVTKEDEHMEAIAPWLDPRGTEVPIAFTLRAIMDIRPRSAVEAVQVQIDGQPVGLLSPTWTANVLPLVKHIGERGKTAVARGVLKGNSLKADIVLFVAKAQDVDPSWIQELGPAERQAQMPEDSRPSFDWDDESRPN